MIVVPAKGLYRPSEWLDESQTLWLWRLVNNVEPTADVLEYVYPPNNAGSLAQQLLAEGPNLLRDLYDRCTRNQVWSRQRAVRRS